MLWNTGEDKMIDGLILSIQFLTRIPVKKAVDFNDKNLSKSIFFFPLVGIIIGGLGGVSYSIFSHLNENTASFFALLSMVAITGGLHLDGLADTCDGFLSYRKKEQVLEIMKDSRIGTFGVISIVMDILLKYILILSLDKNIPIILALSYGNSRLVIAYLMSSKKVARKDGIGYMFHRSNPKTYALFGGIGYLLIVLLVKPIYIIPLFFSFLIGQVMTKITYRKIDGFTGDVYGATIELSEIVSLIIFLEVLRWT
ncbi:adenosylcobinamide-GDP ribazoletransferase [Tepidimicrobium xylanilyticum]|uniref:Adenosylcobinamide-GDP ribazoletransferase n=1 Tax=Tepidimicrobium xylanilyticum TaxID=1123352 RepID=A0A1H2TLM0_9FIRM|nr:adenosylcobinamide-GDP ribazoletransferase [Tepidimicrobium xylanilyticum]GMG95914.1 adenosylcobinamide-GDP ribazoletransferase [Tepidimicrobium xylanilyticum]SDW44677.1 cobalamin-5'-phosphate synthase [Tepidimicrobium xylanilyticum]